MRGRDLIPAFLLVVAGCAHAAEQVANARDVESAAHYRPPAGFQGHAWGEPLSAFRHFEADPLYVQTAFSRGKITLVDMQCVAHGLTGCNLEASLRTLRQKTEGEGFHTLAEYYVASEAVRFSATEALLFPLFYQFCARWGGFSGSVPEDIQERMTFCGMRMLFRSETLEEMRPHPDAAEIVTNYDRVLQQLIAMHGEPEDYEKRGLVIIRTPDETIVQPRDRRFDEWRWCSLRTDRDIAPRCDASVVLAFDARTGWGVVLYATRPVWEFAYARHHGGAEDDPLYRLLTGLQQYHPANPICTGSNLCRPGSPSAMRHESRARFRLRSAVEPGVALRR